MLEFYRTRHNLRKADLWGGETRMHTLPDGTVTPATGKFVVGHLRFHHFYTATDEDFHNHQVEFWTFPFQTYLEEILVPLEPVSFDASQVTRWRAERRVVPAWQWSYRDTRTPHRIIGPCAPDGSLYPWDERHIRTVIWRGRVIPPGTTGFYLPTAVENVYEFLTFEAYITRQKARAEAVKRVSAHFMKDLQYAMRSVFEDHNVRGEISILCDAPLGRATQWVGKGPAQPGDVTATIELHVEGVKL